MKATALIVEDDPTTLQALEDFARREGFRTTRASDLAEARASYGEIHPDVILCDLVLPDGHGTELLAEVEEDPAVEVIVITANATLDSAVEALRRGAHDYLEKPVDVERLRILLAQIRRTVGLKSQVRTLRSELRELGRFGRLVGASRTMQQIYDLIEKVAPTEATVLVTGESGTGKELVAETLHGLSRRAEGPLVPVNCGAISPELIESELFGHERGSFTGADRQHRGYFERADGGTLFLDEITEMPAELQVRLLRVLETGRVTRVGGTVEIEVDVRLVAATNRDPAQAVEGGALREDLYFRLNVFPIPLPPLRNRPDDVPVLVEHFLREVLSESGAAAFTDEAFEVLKRHPWPGNVRELRNVVQHAVIMAPEDGRLGIEQLPAAVRGPARGGRERVLAPAGMPLDDVIRAHTFHTLEHFGGNKSRTAEALGISLKTLYNRLERWAGQEDDTS